MVAKWTEEVKLGEWAEDLGAEEKPQNVEIGDSGRRAAAGLVVVYASAFYTKQVSAFYAKKILNNQKCRQHTRTSLTKNCGWTACSFQNSKYTRIRTSTSESQPCISKWLSGLRACLALNKNWYKELCWG